MRSDRPAGGHAASIWLLRPCPEAWLARGVLTSPFFPATDARISSDHRCKSTTLSRGEGTPHQGPGGRHQE